MPPTDVPQAGRKRRTRRLRSPHPNVKIKAPRRALDAQGKPVVDALGNPVWKGRVSYYRLVYVDPETGKAKAERIDPMTHPNEDTRTDLATRRAREIAKRKGEIEDGAPVASGLSFGESFRKYLANKPDLDPDTRKEYETHLSHFATWAADEEVNTTPDKLTRAALMDFPAWAYKLPKHSPSRGANRGAQKKRAGRRSIPRINTHIRVVRGALGWMHAKDLLPKIRNGDLTLALKQYKEPKNPPEFLDRQELKDLIRAALRHDADCYALTRAEREKHGYKSSGSTTRYNPIAPLVVGAILTGMRIDELCLIEWRIHIDLMASDFNGQPMGQIKLRAEDTKTRKARNVAFDVSPGLRQLITELRRASGSSKGTVFGITTAEADGALNRLRDRYGAPDRFTWQMCRSTCATFLVCSPGIYGGGPRDTSPFHESRQLGHSQKVAEESYVGLIKGISKDLRSLEAAMEIEAEVNLVIESVMGKQTSNVVPLRA